MDAPTERGLLDTNLVIQLSHVDPHDLPSEPMVSVVTIAELSVGPLVTDDEAERSARLAHLQQAEADFDPIAFDSAAARAFGRVAADLRHHGRKPAARAFDALIAATAIAHGLPLYTANPEDFVGITGLDLRSVETAIPAAGSHS